MNSSSALPVKSMPMPTSRKSGDGLSDQFPAGLRVLVVDDDRICLTILERMLRDCLYEVTKCNQGAIALSLLRENKNGFDIVISDVHMPDMDGFKLLEYVGLEMDLPVIMMSADDRKCIVMKGVTHGACDFLIKPVRIEALKNIWQHVVRKRKHEWKDFEQASSAEDGDRKQKPPEDPDYSSSANDGNWRNSKRRRDDEDEAEERDDTSGLKKPRVVWSVELHQQFVAAVNQLGIDKAVPKKILELMNVPGLTRENVASHLQKYRLYLRRLSGGPQSQNGINSTFMGNPEAAFGSMSSLSGLDLQALAASGQLPVQSLATFQAAALGRTASKSSISMPWIDQRNLFSFETPKLRFGEGQHLHNNSKQINLLHGIPTNMEPKQLSNFHQSLQSFNGVNMQVTSNGSHSTLPLQITQLQSSAQTLDEANGNNFSRVPTTVGRPILSDSVNIGIYDAVKRPSPAVDFSLNNSTDLLCNNFPPRGSNLGISSLTTSRGPFQENVSSEVKEPKGLDSSYDIFHELEQQKTPNWNSKTTRLAYDASMQTSIQGHEDVLPSALVVQQGFSSTQNGHQNIGIATAKVEFSAGKDNNHTNLPNMNSQLDRLLPDNSPRVKEENLSSTDFQNTLVPQQFGQEDLMSALIKQQGVLPIESEFAFDGYNLDNLPV